MGLVDFQLYNIIPIGLEAFACTYLHNIIIAVYNNYCAASGASVEDWKKNRRVDI